MSTALSQCPAGAGLRLERAASVPAALCDGGDEGRGRRLVAALLWGLRAWLALGCLMQAEGCGAGCGMLPGKEEEEEEGRGRAVWLEQGSVPAPFPFQVSAFDSK